MEWDFFLAVNGFILLHGCFTWTWNKMHWEKATWELHQNTTGCIQQILEATSHKTTAAPHLTSYLSKTNKTCGALQEKQGESHNQCSHIDSCVRIVCKSLCVLVSVFVFVWVIVVYYCAWMYKWCLVYVCVKIHMQHNPNSFLIVFFNFFIFFRYLTDDCCLQNFMKPKVIDKLPWH